MKKSEVLRLLRDHFQVSLYEASDWLDRLSGEKAFSKREKIAVEAMKSLQRVVFDNARDDLVGQMARIAGSRTPEKIIAVLAIKQADALLSELREQTNEKQEL